MECLPRAIDEIENPQSAGGVWDAVAPQVAQDRFQFVKQAYIWVIRFRVGLYQTRDDRQIDIQAFEPGNDPLQGVDPEIRIDDRAGADTRAVQQIVEVSDDADLVCDTSMKPAVAA